MGYFMQEDAAAKGPTAQRIGLEFSAVLAVVFLGVRFGGWHHGMDPLGYTVHAPTWMALLIAAVVGGAFAGCRMWFATDDAERDTV